MFFKSKNICILVISIMMTQYLITSCGYDEVVSMPVSMPSQNVIDLPDGYHVYTFCCGCTYEGYWENGLPNGLGKYTQPMMEETSEGTLIPEGMAIIEGHFVDGIAHGMVTYTRIWSDRTWIFEFEADMGWQIEDSVVNAEGIGLPARFPLVIHLVMDHYLATNENWQRYDY